MPIYEYRCADCEEKFSRLQSIGAGSTGVQCPKCGSHQVERLLSSFASGPTAGGGAADAGPGCGSGFSGFS